jgi:hypothetical protein
MDTKEQNGAPAFIRAAKTDPAPFFATIRETSA